MLDDGGPGVRDRHGITPALRRTFQPRNGPTGVNKTATNPARTAAMALMILPASRGLPPPGTPMPPSRSQRAQHTGPVGDNIPPQVRFFFLDERTQHFF